MLSGALLVLCGKRHPPGFRPHLRLLELSGVKFLLGLAELSLGGGFGLLNRQRHCFFRLHAVCERQQVVTDAELAVKIRLRAKCV